MAEKHVEYYLENAANNSVGEVMYRIFTFVSSSGQNAVRFAHNSTATSVSGNLGYGGSPTGFADFPSGSFIVVESTAAMPSGYRWQVLFERSSVSTITAQLSTIGGWEGGNTKNFISNSTNNPPGITPPVTDRVQWLTTGPAVRTNYQFSSSDLDTYGPNATSVAYFRINQYLPSAAEGSQFVQSVLVGGYIPFNPLKNTNPCCLIARIPNTNAGSSFTFAFANANSNSASRVSPDFDFHNKDLSYAYGGVASVTAFGSEFGIHNATKENLGGMANTPVFVVSYSAQATPGYFGKYCTVAGNVNRADGTVDVNREYQVVNGYMFRWKPTA